MFSLQHLMSFLKYLHVSSFLPLKHAWLRLIWKVEITNFVIWHIFDEGAIKVTQRSWREREEHSSFQLSQREGHSLFQLSKKKHQTWRKICVPPTKFTGLFFVILIYLLYCWLPKQSTIRIFMFKSEKRDFMKSAYRTQKRNICLFKSRTRLFQNIFAYYSSWLCICQAWALCPKASQIGV